MILSLIIVLVSTKTFTDDLVSTKTFTDGFGFNVVKLHKNRSILRLWHERHNLKINLGKWRSLIKKRARNLKSICFLSEGTGPTKFWKIGRLIAPSYILISSAFSLYFWFSLLQIILFLLKMINFWT